MTTHTFLTEANTGNPTIYAIYSEKIETLFMSDCYGNYGQQISAGDAGDHLSLDTQKAVDFAIAKAKEYEDFEETEPDYSVGDIISAYEDGSIYDAVAKGLTSPDITLFKEEVKGFTYWDGHNFKTIIVKSEHSEPTHVVIEDEKLIAELEKAIEEKEYNGEGFGQKHYKGNGYIVTDNYCGGAWATWEIISEADHEMIKGNS